MFCGACFGVVPFALLMAWPAIVPFTAGALGCAAMMGLGNGAVFKLVPEYFPGNTATVTGLVGAWAGWADFSSAGSGAFRDGLGIWPGLCCFGDSIGTLVLEPVFLPRQRALDLTMPPEYSRGADQLRAGAWASMTTALLLAAIVVGSRNLQILMRRWWCIRSH
jgi:hypothetical protein